MRSIVLIAAISLMAVPSAFGESPRNDPAALEFFEKKIRPLLVDNCYTCHSANTNSKGGLRVDDRNGLLNLPKDLGNRAATDSETSGNPSRRRTTMKERHDLVHQFDVHGRFISSARSPAPSATHCECSAH